MRGIDEEVLATALAWRASGRNCALLTVLSTYGGSPRPSGSMAAIRDDGLICGAVSGGCVEDDLSTLMRLPNWFDTAPPVSVQVFGADAEDRARLRLPCDNTLRVAIESNWNAEVVQHAIEALGQGRAVLRMVSLTDGTSRLEANGTDASFSECPTHFTVPLGPQHRAYLVGANDVARYLSAWLPALGYEVLLCDPRPEYADAWTDPHLPVCREMPDDWLMAQPPHHRSAVITLSHDPKIDDLALLEALDSPAFYVGAIGSSRTTEKRRERMHVMGVNPVAVDRLRGPVGLPIGSQTPAEIAVSIAAELVAIRTPRARPSG